MALSASIAYHGQSILSSAGVRHSLRIGTAVKGKQLTLWLISAYSSIGWITIVIGRSVFCHLWVKKMAELDQLNGNNQLIQFFFSVSLFLTK